MFSLQNLKKYFTSRRVLLGRNKWRGFTLIELMVTISIFTVITTVIIYENSKFNSSVLLTNLAYKIALTIRQAQVYGVSSKKVTVGGVTGGSAYQRGYGVHFNVNDPANKKKFVFFADANDNGKYNVGEEISITNIAQNQMVSTLCFKRGGPEICHHGQGNGRHSEGTILFKRPSSDAQLSDKQDGNSLEQIKIVLSPINDTSIKRCVIVNAGGQIAVKGQNSC